MEWVQVATIVGILTAVIGLQSFWITRALDGLRGQVDVLRAEVYRGFDRIEGRQPPSLRRI